VSEEFVGAGWAFPMAIDATGSVAIVRREREIEESIRLILGTSYGERPMRPEFGCGIHELVFAPADSATAARIAYEVRQSLDRWEPRIDVIDVDVTTSDTDASALYVHITYSIRGSNNPRNLVFPFYVIPSEEASP
jgi:uncharacterized protein